MPTLSANQITWSRLLIQIHILIYKQCRSRSVGFFRSQQIWIYTVCKGRTYPGSAGPGLKALLGKGQRSDIIIYGLLKSWFVLGLIHYPYMDLTHIRMYIRKSQTKFHKYKTCPLHIMSIFLFFDLGFTALSRIFHLYRADRSSKVGENWRTWRKTTWPSVSRTWLSHIWPKRGSNHSGEKPNGLRVNSLIH